MAFSFFIIIFFFVPCIYIYAKYRKNNLTLNLIKNITYAQKYKNKTIIVKFIYVKVRFISCILNM